MITNSSELPDQFVQILTEHFELSPDQLTPSTTFMELDMDSLALMQLVVAAEAAFGVVLPEQIMSLSSYATLGEAARMLAPPEPRRSSNFTPPMPAT
ncbi:acyl carrier protein [Streptomyces cellostaticus]|uniref:acyl carrier protein n=1 Tax=Streptomyces cellostaticus TaxID=67285 RepID=UPI000AE2F3DE|nr:acyl carrier protein [Streptomyces cellostaticus]GHI02746.1 hypothetical protein Scel_10670 [Streptomyces cellostaticus]